MLRLDRLELSGFKSFVDPVELRFAGGVTGIVGPNGCGKSNLADAITWVLGEQSAKSMRGETMEDVIFSGSEKRKPLGLGEVTLSFLADPGTAGSDDGRLTISRRVFRSGESNYRINGKTVRLKEIKDLLMDTGLGIRAYSVIEQGKIGMILSGKPQERRRLIEEAAGITRYKARKRVAEVKLEEASANLLRIDDILAEVERNLRSLKRQAGAARRWLERKAELDELQRTVLLGRWARLAGELAERRAALGDAQTHEAGRSAEVAREEAALAERREALERLAEALAERVRRQAELGATIEGRQQFLSGARRTVVEIEARLEAGAATAERRAAEAAQREGALADLEAQRAELVGDHDRAAAEVEADGARLREVEAAAADGETRLETARRDLLASLGELDALRNRIHREQIESEKGAFRQRHLFEELQLRGQELEEAAREVAAAEGRLADLESGIAGRAGALDAARAGLDELLAREAAATARLREAESHRAGRRERQRFLAELAAGDGDRTAETAARLAAAGLPDPVRLGGQVRALRGWEAALDLYLGELVEAVIVPSQHSARALAARLAESGRAAAALLSPLDPPATGSGLPEDPAIVASLGEALGLAPQLAAALRPAFLVDGAEAAERLARAWPGTAFLTRDRIWFEGGIVHLQGVEAQPGFLARTSELADLDQELPRLERDIAAARAEIDTLVEARAEAAKSIHRAQDELAGWRQERAAVNARRDELMARHRRLAANEASLVRERHELGAEIERLVHLQQASGEELGRLERLHAEREAAFDQLRAGIEELRRERETVRAIGAGRRGQLDVLTERLRSLEQQRSRVERELEAARRESAAWEIDARELAARRVSLLEGIDAAERELAAALALAAGGGDAVRAEEGRLEEERQQVRQRDETLSSLRLTLDAARARVGEERVALAGLDHDAAHLAEQLRERCQLEPPELPGEAPAALAELEADLLRLREQVESFGPVNVLAAEELTAEEERRATMSAQRADIARSIESLRQTIREINQTSSARFQETFAQVNEQFSRTFVELFRGGEAEMRLMDEEDLLESGIEIVARPPGKRLQNLMLLSGGEKALTAIALLFALFRIKPSPFCILDEVDAPLDDVNTLRYVHMLRQLARETQCIVITHNKLTMEVCGTLYGVTMEERGVSKLVAVALEEVQPEEAAAATA